MADMIDHLIEEVIEELLKEEHKALTPLQSKKHKAKQRRDLDKKKAKKKEYLPGFAELSALGRGVVEESDDIERQKKIYELSKRLIELENQIVQKQKHLIDLQKRIDKIKPSIKDYLVFCSKISDATKGKITPDSK